MPKSVQKQASLSIELLPEFGQLLNGQPVYGPGSVFQGIVHLSLPSPKHNAHRLSLVFHATESVQLHSTMASVIRGRHHQLFGTQRILWEARECNSTDPTGPYRFTIQMPMLQHPPSMDYHRLRYKCRFKLTAILEQDRRSTPLLTAHQTVHYRPWIPTRALKVPMIRHSKWLVIQTMTTTDVVAGETYQLTLTPFPDTPNLKATLELVQIVTLPHQMHDERIPPSETILTRSEPLVLTSSQPHPLVLLVPAATPPTYSFGRVIRLHYELVLRISCWKNARWTAGFAKAEEEVRLPVVIGTLGHGIHVPDDLQHYTDLRGLFEDRNVIARSEVDDPSIVPVPKFLPSVEYENTLPSYLPSTLPPYDSSTSHCVSA